MKFRRAEETIDIMELKHPERNVRIHGREQISELVRSLKFAGQIRPILIDEKNVVLAGNGLLDAMLECGYTEAWVSRIQGASENDKKKIMTMDNRIFTLGADDYSVIEDFIRELTQDGEADIPGYNDKDIADIVAEAENTLRQIEANAFDKKDRPINTAMEFRKVPVRMLKPAKYNPRKDLQPGDPAYEKIKRSLHDFGYVDPIIWNEDTGNIVGGHQRYKVLKAEGAIEIDCVVVHIKNPADEKALNIALNKATGEWEPEALAELLSELQAAEYDLGRTAFDADEIDDIFSQIDGGDAKDDDFDTDAALGKEPFVQLGDLWQLGRHWLLCGDATNPDDFERLMGGKRANLCVTDPPYNVAYESSDGKKIQNDDMADGAFYNFLLAAFKNIAASLADGGSAYVFHADTEGLNFRRAFKDAGFKISGVCIWVKNSLVLGRSPYQWQHEPILYGWLPNGKHKWYADRKQTTVWNFPRPSKSELHPTMKPVPLIAYPVGNSSAPNGIVLDPFGGSGSTLIACEQSDRIAYIMELDPKYASTIVLRYLATSNAPEQIHVLRNGETLQFQADWAK